MVASAEVIFLIVVTADPYITRLFVIFKTRIKTKKRTTCCKLSTGVKQHCSGLMSHQA